MFAMFFFNTLYIQRVLGYGPLEAGSRSCRSRPGSWCPPGSLRSSRRRLGVRPVAIVGMVVTIAGMLLLTRIPADGTYAVDVLPALVLTALGLGAVVRAADADRDDGPRERATRASPPGSSTRRSRSAARSGSRSSRPRCAATHRTRPAARAGGARAGLPRRVRRRRRLHGVALVAFLALLRRRDVERIEAEAATAASF